MNPRPLAVGNGYIFVASEDFLNGYQAGHLTYMATKKLHPEPFTDEYITGLVLDKLEDMSYSSIYGIGYAVGWLKTLAEKGMKGGQP